jgi:hypothetical protein
MQIGDNRWEKDHEWLIPWLWALGGLLLLLAAFSSRWVRNISQRLGTSEETAEQRGVRQGTSGHKSPGAIATSSGRAYAAGGDVNVFETHKSEPTEHPKIVLGYAAEPLYRGFDILNRGSDAIRVHLRPTQSKNYTLTSDTVQHLLANSPLKSPLIVHVEHKTTGQHIEGEDAWNEFAQDVWMETLPFEVAKPDDVDAVCTMLNKISNDMNTQQIIVPLHVDYSDLVGGCYESSASVTWNPLTKTGEVRPGSVKRKEC